MRRTAIARWLAASMALALPLRALAQLAAVDDMAFTQEAAARFKAALPASDVRVIGPRTLTLRVDKAVVNLDRTRLACTWKPQDCSRQLDALIASVAETLHEPDTPPDPARLRVVVRSEDMLTLNGVRLRDSGAALQWHSLGDGLASVVVLDAPTTMRYVLEKDLKALHLDGPQAFERALANLRATLRPFGEAVPSVAPGVVGHVVGDGSYASSRLLFPEDWKALAAEHGVLVVAVPRPPTMQYVTDDAPATIAALRERARQSAGHAPDALSTILLRWTPDGWRPI